MSSLWPKQYSGARLLRVPSELPFPVCRDMGACACLWSKPACPFYRTKPLVLVVGRTV